MSRRVSLPGAAELFRPTKDGEDAPERPEQVPPVGSVSLAVPEVVPPDDPEPPAESASETEADEEEGHRKSSGRVRHDEKMTVYVTADELFDLEIARLSLRREHGAAVDRGRLVREAIAIVLADLDQYGGDSAIARRLAAS